MLIIINSAMVEILKKCVKIKKKKYNIYKINFDFFKKNKYMILPNY